MSKGSSLETGTELSPKFDSAGLIPCVTTDSQSGEVLMFAYMNREALEKTIKTRQATYFSRTREKLWVKGETSGHFQKVDEIRIDCDQDCVWLKVTMMEPGCCHNGYRSCFYRRVKDGTELEFAIGDRAFDPQTIYGNKT